MPGATIRSPPTCVRPRAGEGLAAVPTRAGIVVTGTEVLTGRVTDRNFRLFAERRLLHVMNGSMSLQGTDPFALFDQMLQKEKIDPSHAFYLGYEMAKAVTALTLGKNYVQDQALRWGFLTAPEPSHRGAVK